MINLIVAGILLVAASEDPVSDMSKEPTLANALITLATTVSFLIITLLIKPIREKITRYVKFLISIDVIMAQIETVKAQNESNLKETKELIKIANEMAIAQAERDAVFSKVVDEVKEFTVALKAMDDKIGQIKDTFMDKLSSVQQRVAATEAMISVMRNNKQA